MRLIVGTFSTSGQLKWKPTFEFSSYSGRHALLSAWASSDRVHANLTRSPFHEEEEWEWRHRPSAKAPWQHTHPPSSVQAIWAKYLPSFWVSIFMKKSKWNVEEELSLSSNLFSVSLQRVFIHCKSGLLDQGTDRLTSNKLVTILSISDCKQRRKPSTHRNK